MAKILAFAGSLREHSYSKRVLNIAVEGAREAGADVTVVDLRDYPMPVFNSDECEKKFDENALKFQDILAVHDGFLIASPEYNGSIPGGLKNAIDWASRANDKYGMYDVFKGKTAAMMTASPGAFGGLRCLNHLRGVLTIMGIWVLPSEIAVSSVAAKFDGDSLQITDAKMEGVLKKHGASLAETIADAALSARKS